MKDKNNGEAVFISQARLVHPYPLITEMIGDEMAEKVGLDNLIVPFLLPKMPPDRPDNVSVMKYNGNIDCFENLNVSFF